MESRQLQTLLSAFSVSFLGVALMLQLVYMVVTPLVCGGVQVDLPVVANAIELFESETDLAVTIRRDGFVVLGPSLVPSSRLAEELARRLSYGPRRVFVSADRQVKYRAVQEVIVAAQNAGVRSVRLVTFRGNALEALPSRNGG